MGVFAAHLWSCQPNFEVIQNLTYDLPHFKIYQDLAVRAFSAIWNVMLWVRLFSLELYIVYLHLDALVQERRNSSALAMELRLSCTNPSTWSVDHLSYFMKKSIWFYFPSYAVVILTLFYKKVHSILFNKLYRWFLKCIEIVNHLEFPQIRIFWSNKFVIFTEFLLLL